MRKALLLSLALAALMSGCSGPAAAPDAEASPAMAPEPGRLVAEDFTATGSVLVSEGRLSCSPADELRECEGFLFWVGVEGDEADVRDGLVVKARLSWGNAANSFGLTLTDVEGREMATSVPESPTARSLEMTIVRSANYYLQVDPLVAAADDFTVEALFEPAPGLLAD